MAFCAAGAALCALDWSGEPELFARQALCFALCFVHADACLCGSGRRNALCAPTLGCVWQAQYFRLVVAERSAQLRGWRNTLRSCALVCTQRSAWAGAKARVGKVASKKRPRPTLAHTARRQLAPSLKQPRGLATTFGGCQALALDCWILTRLFRDASD